MPKTMKKGPLSPEDAAENWATTMYARLRCKEGWRRGIVTLLQEEYSHFSWATGVGGTLGVQTVWEYYQLIHATSQYLRTKQNPLLAALFYKRAARDLEYFNEQLKRLPFDERELQSMHQATQRMIPLILKWGQQQDTAQD